MNAVWKERLVQAGFAASGIVLYLVLNLVSVSDNTVSEQGILMRAGYGGDEQNYQLSVVVEEDLKQEIPVNITVSPQSYDQKEAEQVFEAVMEGLEEQIRGENPSLMNVSHDLKLLKFSEASGVRLRWYSSNTDVIDSSGKLKTEIERVQMVPLQVQLSVGAYQADYEILVRVVPREKNGEEVFISGLQKEIEKQDKLQNTSKYLRLPSEYEGKHLRYQEEKHADYVILPFLGILMAIIWPARKQSEQRKKEKAREQELLFDYAELVSKLMVFTGAGMTVRNAWERMVLDYESKPKQRAAYEEMRYTYYQLKNGVSESKAYQDFGRRCKLQPYLKLSSLLEQNRRTGTKDLRRILQNEMTDAFELRKNLARRMGEEAGTKLLLPLFLMLGIVMVMIMVPAMMTMG